MRRKLGLVLMGGAHQIDYILYRQRRRNSIQSAKTRLGAGSDHKLLTAKFRCKLKTVGENTRPFRYDRNQTPYDYTVEVTKIQGIRSDRVLEELWTEVHNIVQEAVIKTSPRKRDAKKQNVYLRRHYK